MKQQLQLKEKELQHKEKELQIKEVELQMKFKWRQKNSERKRAKIKLN
jgi:hypothetical protein